MTYSDDQPYGSPGAKPDLARIALHAEKEAARRRGMWRERPAGRRGPRKSRRGDNGTLSLAAAIDELFADLADPLPDAPQVLAARRELALPPAKVRPVSFEPDTGTLSVRAVSAAWGVNIRLRAPRLISRLNERLGTQQIRLLEVFGPPASSTL
ncbi:DciA family protein [Streptomyces sp. NPDC006872]|uniref:DciA family protein n=1 Tax=Streptomyces sp. NPDC006872 TaxID=3155720 RepID=UPI0033F3F96F